MKKRQKTTLWVFGIAIILFSVIYSSVRSFDPFWCIYIITLPLFGVWSILYCVFSLLAKAPNKIFRVLCTVSAVYIGKIVLNTCLFSALGEEFLYVLSFYSPVTAWITLLFIITWAASLIVIFMNKRKNTSAGPEPEAGS